MTDTISNSSMRRVRLVSSSSKPPILYPNPSCYLNATPINNFALAPLSFQKAIMDGNSSKIAERVLKPSLRKIEAFCPDPSETVIINKSVHFNEPLTQVVHFYTPPPLDEYDEEDEEETEEDEEEEENTLEDAFLQVYLIKGLQDECDSLAIAQPSRRNQAVQNTTNDKHGNNDTDSLSLPNWPSSIHPTRRFISQMVSLENIVWNHTLQVVQGRVVVHNIAFEKNVTVRCSFDDWQSWIDVEAYYEEPAFNSGLSGSNNAFDRFLFDIKLRDCHQFSCSMAIRYQTLGQEFWDNNNGSNFTVQSMPPAPRDSFKQSIQFDNNKEELSIISGLGSMESNNSNQETEKKATSPTATTRHQLDRFRFSKYGASKIAVPAAISTKKRPAVLQQTLNSQLDVDLYNQNSVFSSASNNSSFHSVATDEAIELREPRYNKL